MQDVCVHLSYQGDLPEFISGNEKYHYKRSMGPHQIHTPKTPNTHTQNTKYTHSNTKYTYQNTEYTLPDSQIPEKPPNEQGDSRSVRY